MMKNITSIVIWGTYGGYIFYSIYLGTLLRCCVLSQGTSPSNASLDSGENEYLVGQRWQCVR